MSSDDKGWEEALPGGTWKPQEEGDEIVGTLVDVQSEVGVNGSMLYTLENKDGERVNVWGSAVLDPRMRGVKLNSEVKIVYKGLGEKKGGKQAPKLFQVFHRPPADGTIPF